MGSATPPIDGFQPGFCAEKILEEIRGSGRPSDLGTPAALGVLENNISPLEIRSNISPLEIRGSGGSPAVLSWA